MDKKILPELIVEYAAQIIAAEANVDSVPNDSVLALLVDAVSFHLCACLEDPSNKGQRAAIYNIIHARMAEKLDLFVRIAAE